MEQVYFVTVFLSNAFKLPDWNRVRDRLKELFAPSMQKSQEENLTEDVFEFAQAMTVILNHTTLALADQCEYPDRRI